MTLRGSLQMLYLHDIAEAIDTDKISSGAEPRRAMLRHSAPEYVGFAKPPVVEDLPATRLENGERLTAQISFYEYGVAGIKLEMPFEMDWPDLVRFANRWIGSAESERLASQLIAGQIKRIENAIVKRFDRPLSEDYYIIRVDSGSQLASELLEQHAPEIAQIVRGELVPLSDEEQHEVLDKRISYYPNDLLVAGWTAAFVYDNAEGADATMRLLEYANMQLLEFRHYDRVLTEVLQRVYQQLEKKRGFLSRWRLAREAEELNTIRLDVSELTERIDNSIKFLSDMYSARLYRMAARRVGVNDYRDSVEEKLRTAGELYHHMMDEFHQGRAFVLELMVVIILIIDLFYLFRGKSE
jgi:hypothetical protein